jgi:hypothetical protein
MDGHKNPTMEELHKTFIFCSNLIYLKITYGDSSKQMIFNHHPIK